MTAARPLGAVRAGSLLCALLAAVATSVAGWGSPGAEALPLLALAVAVAELAVVHLQVGRQRWTFSLTEAALGAALVCAPGAWTAVGMAVGVAGAQLLRRQPAVKLGFNVAQFALAAALAALVAEHAGGGEPGACAGLLVFWAVNHVLVAIVIAGTAGRPLRDLLLSQALVSALHTAGNASIGLLAAYLALNAPLGLLGLVVPLGLLWVSYDQQSRRSAEARLYAELARGQEQARARSTDVSAAVVVTAAARLLGGADVELVMLAPGGPVRYVGGEEGTPARQPVDADAFDEPWVLRALGAGRVASGVEDGRPWCSAVLGEPRTPSAVLLARRAPSAPAFSRADLRLAGVLVGQAETWLSVADLSERHRAAREQVAGLDGAARALGDIGARTTPALTVLRDSASRLTVLADVTVLAAGARGVDDIVAELHMVELAVASLLGAVALAAEPDLLAAGGPVQVPSPQPREWTSTGLVR